MTGDRPALLGLVLYLLVAVTPTLILWVALRLFPAAVSMIVERPRLRRPRPGPALATAVANLRRLRRELCGRPQATQVRRLALIAAYDETLLDVCRIVGVDAPLDSATGRDRAFARLLTEAALEEAGIVLDPPAEAA